MIPVRAQGPLPTVTRVFDAGHGLEATACPACDEPIGTGPVALVYIGPGPEWDDQVKARAGKWHTGAAVAVHAACAGLPSAEETGS